MSAAPVNPRAEDEDGAGAVYAFPTGVSVSVRADAEAHPTHTESHTDSAAHAGAAVGTGVAVRAGDGRAPGKQGMHTGGVGDGVPPSSSGISTRIADVLSTLPGAAAGHSVTDKLHAVLSALRNQPGRLGYTLDELEDITQMSLGSDNELVLSLRTNPKIKFTEFTGRFRYLAEFAAEDRHDLVRHLRQRGRIPVHKLVDAYAGAPADIAALTRSGGFPLPADGGVIRIHNDRGGVKDDVLYHRPDLISSGSDVPLSQVIKLSGTLSLTSGSRIARTTADLTLDLFRNDMILIEGRAFRVSSEHVALPKNKLKAAAADGGSAAGGMDSEAQAGIGGEHAAAAMAAAGTKRRRPDEGSATGDSAQKRGRGSAGDGRPAPSAGGSAQKRKSAGSDSDDSSEFDGPTATDEEEVPRDHDKEDRELFGGDESDEEEADDDEGNGSASEAPGAAVKPAAASKTSTGTEGKAAFTIEDPLADLAPTQRKRGRPARAAAKLAPEFGIFTTSVGNGVRQTGGWFSVADTGPHQLKSGAAYAQPFTAVSLPLDREWDGPDCTGVVAYRIGASSDIRAVWRLMVNSTNDDIADATGYTRHNAALAALHAIETANAASAGASAGGDEVDGVAAKSVVAAPGADGASSALPAPPPEFLHQIGGAGIFRNMKTFPVNHLDLRRQMVAVGLGETPMIPGTLEGEDPMVLARRQQRQKRVRKPNERSLRIQSNEHIMQSNDLQARTLMRIRYEQVAQEYVRAKAALNAETARTVLATQGFSAQAAAARRL